MINYFGFIDETGALHNDLDQRFFALGLLKCEDTSALYEELRILKNRVEAKLQFCSLVLDKTNPNIKISDVFPDTWEAYIAYSKLLVKNNVKPGDKICIISDFLGKPKVSNKYYEPEIKSLPVVYNATVLESHASLFIQLVDYWLGVWFTISGVHGNQKESSM
jgi:hypothetical protein